MDIDDTLWRLDQVPMTPATSVILVALIDALIEIQRLQARLDRLEKKE